MNQMFGVGNSNIDIVEEFVNRGLNLYENVWNFFMNYFTSLLFSYSLYNKVIVFYSSH
jgi:hypothetical protein